MTLRPRPAARVDTVARTDPWVSDDMVPPDAQAWDLVVIGGGTAGIVAARTAAGFGASVLLVEGSRPGGDCLWTGCVPSKALLAAAHAAADARAAARFGVHADGVRADFGEVMAHVRAAVENVEPDDSPATLRAAGVRLAHGRARFTGPDTVAVTPAGDYGWMAAVSGTDRSSSAQVSEVSFRHAIVATGSRPLVPQIPGLDDADPMTSDSVWALAELPQRLLVLGGGSIGCELAQAFARLGSQVTIVEGTATLLPREDSYAAGLLRAALAEDGVTVTTGARLAAVERQGTGFLAHIEGGVTVPFDRILVAVGREPRTTGLGLAEAGVAVGEHGVVRVDDRLRTTNARVHAAGDVTGHPRFTHVAGVHASVAASNAVLGLRRRAQTAAIPRVTFTQPEVAAVGVSPEDAERSGHIVHTVHHDDVDRARAEDACCGVTRLVVDHRGRVVGGSIVGPRAGESLAELVLATTRGLRARDLAAAIHAYPTYGDAPWKASIADVRERLTRRPVRIALRLLAARARRV